MCANVMSVYASRTFFQGEYIDIEKELNKSTRTERLFLIEKQGGQVASQPGRREDGAALRAAARRSRTQRERELITQ